MLLAAIALLLPARMPGELGAYLRKPDRSYSVQAPASKGPIQEFRMTSQTWKGTPWEHLVLFNPGAEDAGDLAILFVTGDGPRDGDRLQLQLLAGATKMPIAMLFSVPNQPIYGMREDDLIAHTFEKYLETGDAEWPLLFPMAKSAIRAMDAVQAVAKKSGRTIKRFLVTGASKRGWTSWLAGASGDRRVAGIAPMVIDNLNIPAQMKGQLAAWGEYSPMIQDYTRRGLQAKMDTPRGRKLTAMVDPYSYRSGIRVPTLIVNGANDPYWTVNALSNYWDGLSMQRWVRVVPNVGHDLGGGAQAAETIGAFARHLAGKHAFPTMATQIRRTETGLAADAQIARLQADSITLWVASSVTTDFRRSQWVRAATADLAKPRDVPVQKGNLKAEFAGEPMKRAALVEARFTVDGRSFSLTSPVTVFR